MKLKAVEDQVRATLKIHEAAKIAGVGTRAIYVGVKAGEVPHLMFGRNIPIPRTAFLRWLDTCAGKLV